MNRCSFLLFHMQHKNINEINSATQGDTFSCNKGEERLSHIDKAEGAWAQSASCASTVFIQHTSETLNSGRNT